MQEPVYEFVRGKGWIPSPDENLTRILEHDGKRYRVTVLKTSAPGLCRTVYSRVFDETLWKEVQWWEEWEGLPEGFGGGHPLEEGDTNWYRVLTEALDD